MSKKIPEGTLTEKQLRRLVKAEIEEHGTQSSWAVDNGLTPQAVGAYLRRVTGAGIKIPEIVGYEPMIVYIPKKSAELRQKSPKSLKERVERARKPRKR